MAFGEDAEGRNQAVDILLLRYLADGTIYIPLTARASSGMFLPGRGPFARSPGLFFLLPARLHFFDPKRGSGDDNYPPSGN